MEKNMKKRGFTLLEVVISIAIFLLTIIPAMEFNRKMLETYRKYSAIENGIKNIEILEKQIRSKGYKKLNEYIGEYHYELLEDSFSVEGNGILNGLNFLFLGRKGERILVKIERIKNISTVEEKSILSLKIEYRTKYKNFKVMRLISELEEYYE